MNVETSSAVRLSLSSSSASVNRPLYDPLSLYPENCKERKDGKIMALEPVLNIIKPVLDPLNIYSNKAQVNEDVVMSKAVPFLPRPISLNINDEDGEELAGDYGFDPFNFADTPNNLIWQRQAELKHSRIAMLAAVGWPVSELLHKSLAKSFYLENLLREGDKVPSVLNGGLGRVSPIFWAVAFSIIATIEIFNLSENVTPAIFDPLQMYPKSFEERRQMEAKELINGRLAMCAILVYVVTEFLSSNGIVSVTPFFKI